MEFCKNCDNMYYVCVSKEDGNKLSYYCRQCQFIDEDVKDMTLHFNRSRETELNNVINAYTKHDPTLPRLFNLDCPNRDCVSNKDIKNKPVREILYKRYSDKHLKYVYMCVHCDFSWKTDS